MTAITRARKHLASTVAAAAFATLCVPAAPAPARATPAAAGSSIANTASLTFGSDGGKVTSNTVTLTVDQVIDAAITAVAPRVIVSQDVTPVGFVTANSGNGSERYKLTARGDDAAATIVGWAADSDGNGIYDAAVDRTLDDATIALAAGERRTVFVLVRDVASDREVTIDATITAATGHGAPGTVFVGAGTGGSDAIIGSTGALAAAASILSGTAATPTLVKSQSVHAPDGSTRVMPGAIVTYRLEARLPGPIRAPEVSDTIPDGLDFVAGSITLDGVALTDSGGDDAGSFDGTTVRVTLGDQSAAGTRIIRFQTRIR